MPARTTPTPPRTNTIHITELLSPFFEDEQLPSALFAYFQAYGDILCWAPLPSLARVICVYEREEDAALAKAGAEGLRIPREEPPLDGVSGDDMTDEPIFKVFFAAATSREALSSELSRLQVPTLDKNFLISPPGSPPVGWQQIREDPPNKDTLAEDLIGALLSLTSKAEGAVENEDSPASAYVSPLAPSTTPPATEHVAAATPPQLLIPASQPLSVSTTEEDETTCTSASLSVPAVTLQDFSPASSGADDGRLQAARDAGAWTGVPSPRGKIGDVKATVESMQGCRGDEDHVMEVVQSSSEDRGTRQESGGESEFGAAGAGQEQELGSGLGTGLAQEEGPGKRITPTARPPLGHGSMW